MNTTAGNARLNPRARRAILLILAAVLVTVGTWTKVGTPQPG